MQHATTRKYRLARRGRRRRRRRTIELVPIDLEERVRAVYNPLHNPRCEIVPNIFNAVSILGH